MYHDVTDPQGFTHRLLIEKGQVYGADNLAHGYEPHERKYITDKVIQAIVAKQPLPFGYALVNSWAS